MITGDDVQRVVEVAAVVIVTLPETFVESVNVLLKENIFHLLPLLMKKGTLISQRKTLIAFNDINLLIPKTASMPVIH
jgi:hypothetical protein